MICKSCTPPPVVGDFPIVERSSRGPIPVSLPLPVVVGLVAPSARVRRRAMQAKHRGPQRTIRPLQCSVCWPLSRWISRLYQSAQRPERVRAWSAREQCESPEVARPHLRSASLLCAGWRPTRCRKPGMQVKHRLHRRFSRRYLGGVRAYRLQCQAPLTHQQGPLAALPTDGDGHQICEQLSVEQLDPCREGFCVRVPRTFGITRIHSVASCGHCAHGYLVCIAFIGNIR